MQSRIALPTLEEVNRWAAEMRRTTLEKMWLQSQITASLPDEVKALVVQFAKLKPVLDKEVKEANLLKCCGRIVIAFAEKNIHWLHTLPTDRYLKAYVRRSR